MFKREGQAQRAAVYGTYMIKPVEPGDPFYLARSFVQAICLIIVFVKKVREFNKCKDYCLKHGYYVYFTQVAFEPKGEAPQGESMELRHLIQAIEQDRIDIVLFIDFNWIRRKPGQVERLLKIAEEHQTTLIDVSKERVISQPL